MVEMVEMVMIDPPGISPITTAATLKVEQIIQPQHKAPIVSITVTQVAEVVDSVAAVLAPVLHVHQEAKTLNILFTHFLKACILK